MTRSMKNETDQFTFGKHKGKSLRWVIEHDPSYILWATEEKVIEIPQNFVDRAEDNMLDNEIVEGAWYFDKYGSLSD